MRINLLQNQIDLIMDALKEYTKTSDKRQLIYATYESLLAQTTEKRNENVMKM